MNATSPDPTDLPPLRPYLGATPFGQPVPLVVTTQTLKGQRARKREAARLVASLMPAATRADRRAALLKLNRMTKKAH